MVNSRFATIWRAAGDAQSAGWQPGRRRLRRLQDASGHGRRLINAEKRQKAGGQIGQPAIGQLRAGSRPDQNHRHQIGGRAVCGDCAASSHITSQFHGRR